MLFGGCITLVRILRFGVAWFFIVLTTQVLAQEQLLDLELRESVFKIDVTVSDLFGKKETKPIVITVFRPPGEGKFPLLILNHGRSAKDKRQLQNRHRYLSQARWFVEQGFVVMVPTRVGYGESFSSFDPEFTNACRDNVRLDIKDQALLQQIEATLEFARTLPYVDTSKFLIAGQSLGGYITVTMASKNLPGLVGGINFSGGFGGDPNRRKGNPCGYHVWEQTLKSSGNDLNVPILWIYWKNDWYWGEDIPRRWFAAFLDGGGSGEFVQLSELASDGHFGFSRDMKRWTDAVGEFLRTIPIELKPVVLK